MMPVIGVLGIRDVWIGTMIKKHLDHPGIIDGHGFIKWHSTRILGPAGCSEIDISPGLKPPFNLRRIMGQHRIIESGQATAIDPIGSFDWCLVEQDEDQGQESNSQGHYSSLSLRILQTELYNLGRLMQIIVQTVSWSRERVS